MPQYILQRYSDNGDSTLGLLFSVVSQDLFLEAYSLEDEYREVKVSGETAIPSGLYEVKKRKEVTPMTQRYRDKFDWFDYHLEVQDVHNFTGIYIHLGNYESNTNGCILVGETANLNTQSKGFISNSTKTFKRIYEQMSAELDSGDKIYLEIRDVQNLK